MALNFPSSPGIGSVFTDTTSGFSYQWDGTLWKSYSPASSSNIQILDDISGSFNGSTTTFALTIAGVSFTPVNSQQLRVVLGGVVQAPGTDYYISTNNIVFTTAPSAGLSFSAVSQGPAVPISYANNGNVYVRNQYTGAGTTGPFAFTQGYTIGYLDVYRNGVRLRSGIDFVGTSGTNFFLTDAAQTNDELEAIGYSVSSLVFATANLNGLNVSGISTFGTGTLIDAGGNLKVIGVSTFQSSIFGTNLSLTGVATASSFVGSLTGTASTASFATTSFGLSGTPNLNVGVVTASSFVGNITGNVTGNATGLSGAPNITVTNATVNGTLSVGGTSVILNAATLQINDKDIVVGYTTDANNNDVSNDTTANHGGIAVASTIGNPLINIPLQVGVNSNPFTYKQFMWIKQGNYSGMGTDAWVSNYPISIGNTSSVKNQSLLTVGAGFTVFSSYLDATDIRARNINVSGISTLGITSTIDLRLSSIADNTTIVVGSAITLSYDTGGGNVAICSSPTGPITLNVIGIPTDSSFDNRAISFAVIVQQGATAYACTNITLNGVAFSAAASAGLQTGISYSGGTVATGNTTAYDVFNFTGINTVGSAATTLNYKIISNVSGNYRRY